jgi:hypothetical protein
MPIHDWFRVDAGIFHHFHQRWIGALTDSLNAGLLPEDYYALAEQFASKFGPDVLTLQEVATRNGAGGPAAHPGSNSGGGGGTALLVSPPRIRFVGETDMEFYRRKQNVVAVRHVSGDRIVAMIEIVSPGNKLGQKAFDKFVEKAAALLGQGIHLLLVDLQPRTKRDPQGIHGAIWEAVTGQEYAAPGDKPFTLATYEADPSLRAFVEHVGVGDVLIDMPLFLEPGGHILVPLEATYQTAWAAVPRRWQRVVEGTTA